MKEERKYFILAMAVAAVFCLLGAPFHPLLAGDETRVAGIATEMLVENDWITPRLNGELFLEYPPLYYQLAAASMWLVGIRDLAPSLISGLLSFGCALLCYRLARRWRFSSQLSFCAMVCLLASGNFFANRLECRVDMLLTFSVLFSVTSFVACLQSSGLKRALYFLLFILGMSAGILTKGVVGMLLPLTIICPFILFADIVEKRFRIRRYLAVVVAIPLALILPALWLYLLYRHTPEAVRIILIDNGLNRFSGAQGDHNRSFWYYLISLPEQFQPFLIFVLAGLVISAKKVKSAHDSRAVFRVCALVIPFLALSCASAKRAVYLLPLAPFAALVFAEFLEYVIAQSTKIHRLGVMVKHLRCRQNYYLAGIFALGMVLTVIDCLILSKKAREDSLEPLFITAQRQELTENKTLYLVNAGERTRGAAFYYLCRRVPVLPKGGKPDVNANEMWIVRDKRNLAPGKEFGNRHWLLDTPEARLRYRDLVTNPAKKK